MFHKYAFTFVYLLYYLFTYKWTHKLKLKFKKLWSKAIKHTVGNLNELSDCCCCTSDVPIAYWLHDRHHLTVLFYIIGKDESV